MTKLNLLMWEKVGKYRVNLGEWLCNCAKFYQSLIGHYEILDGVDIDYEYKTTMINFFKH